MITRKVIVIIILLLLVQNGFAAEHWWKLDETSGTTADDFISDANGTFNGSDPCWVDGFIDGAADFKGVSDYFAVTSLDNQYGSNAFTVAGWFKTSQSTGIQTVVGNWAQSKTGSPYYFTVYAGWQVLVENNVVISRFGDGNPSLPFDVTGTSIVNDANWHHFAMVYPYSPTYEPILYVDGQPEGTSGTAHISLINTKFRIGDGNYVHIGDPIRKGGSFCGTIDDIMIFNSVLSAEQVHQLYLDGWGGKAFNRNTGKLYTSVQLAINDSQDGDLIEIAPGNCYESIDLGERIITLSSFAPNNYATIESTVINGNGSSNIINVAAASNIKGLTITGGLNGVSCTGSSPLISNCIIKNNTSNGVYAQTTSSPVIKNCFIYGNDSGLNFQNADGTVQNNTIVKNTNYGIQVSQGTGPAISNCILWANGSDVSHGFSATYSCIEDGNAGTGNISSDPCFVDADNNDFHIEFQSLCVDSGDRNGSYNDQNDIDGQPRVMWIGIDMGADEAEGYSLYNMEVGSVTSDANEVAVITTGATYVLTQTGMDMYRRINPHTNDYDDSNDGKGRLVARLAFDINIGPLVIEVNRPEIAVIQSDKATFKFYSDSFFTITAKDDFTYTHTNIIANAPWNAPLDPNQRGLDRMWTDGYGGSLHAVMSQATAPIIGPNDANNYTTFYMSNGNVMAHTVYPPKKFNFEGLYDPNSRPFVRFVPVEAVMNGILESNDMNDDRDKGFGVYVLWTTCIYVDSIPDDNQVPLPELLNSGIMGFNVLEPERLHNFVELAHNHGFKVIAYLLSPANYSWQGQSIDVTLGWMRKFQSEYDLDGWYFDNANAGEVVDDYDFIRKVRTDIGREGIIYHHDSVDVWDDWLKKYYDGEVNDPWAYRGLKAVFIDAYVNYTLTGETGHIAEVDEPNNPYFRFFASGYGLSQAYGAFQRISNCQAAMSQQEILRAMAENLNGCERIGGYWLTPDPWLTHFKPAYDVRKEEYRKYINNEANNFVPDVKWPIDATTGWFRYPTNVAVNFIDSNVVITWTTDTNSDSEVAYTSNEVWWECPYIGLPDGPDGTVHDSAKVTNHTITLTGLNPNTTYEFKIRSSNGAQEANEIIWGYVGSFTMRTLTVSSTAGGTVTQPGIGVFPYDHGTVVDLNTVPNVCYHFVNWTGTAVDAGKVTDPNSYSTTVLMDANYTVQSNFALYQYTITASAGPNGSIDPWGTFSKDCGSNQDFNAVPNTDYEVNVWTLDGNTVQSGGTTYTLSNITADHNVSVTFKILPPGQANNPSPANSATDVNINADLSWTAGVRAETHDVYFGTTNPPPFIQNQAGTTYEPGTLAYQTTYYWRIDEKNASGTTTGTVWSFTTSGLPSVDIVGSWVSGTTHAKESGANRALVFIAHAENESSLTLNSVTYGGRSMTKVIEKIVSSGNPAHYAYVAAFILDENDIGAASGSTFIPTWSATPEFASYASVFLENVDQDDLVGVTASKSSTSGATLTTASLYTADGDMVIDAATHGDAGDYTLNNGFTEGIESDMNSATGTAGYKSATGEGETPSVTHSSSNSRQVLIGFVVRAVGSPPPVTILGSWATGTSHTKESGTNRALVFIAHAEDDDSPNIALDSVSYGGQTMTKVIDEVVGSTWRAYVAVYILDEEGVNSASGNTFTCSWNQTPDYSSFASVFLQDVNQITLSGASDSNASTSDPITTDAISTAAGDMIIDAATCGNTGSYTMNNGFTEGTDQTMGNTATGATGYKSATSANETPKADFSATVNRQVFVGFVVRR